MEIARLLIAIMSGGALRGCFEVVTEAEFERGISISTKIRQR